MKKLEPFIKRIIPKKYHQYFMGIYSYLRSFYYVGSRYECPFCSGHFRKFLPAGLNNPVLKDVVGGGYRLNAQCPRCNSGDRERLIYLYVKNKTDLLFTNNNIRLLHVAPEKNLQKVLSLKPNIDYISADLKSPLVMVKMDITNIKYEDNYFDVIICNHVLEHIPDDHRAMSELYRVLKPNGWAILQVPISVSLKKTYEDPMVTTPEEREKVFGQSDHVRIYAKDYKDRLENVGFYVDVYNIANDLGDDAICRYGLLRDENIYICSKPTERVFDGNLTGATLHNTTVICREESAQMTDLPDMLIGNRKNKIYK